MGHNQWKVYGEVTGSLVVGRRKFVPTQFKSCFCFSSCRQHKLEEALLFSGRFTDALQALNNWLYRAEPHLAEDVPVSGDKDVVNNLIDKHKVRHQNKCFFVFVFTKQYLVPCSAKHPGFLTESHTQESFFFLFLLC